MYDKGVYSILDYSVEGKEVEEQFDAVLEKTLKLIGFTKEIEAIPFAVFKPSGFGRVDLYKKVGEKIALSLEETEEWNKLPYHTF